MIQQSYRCIPIRQSTLTQQTTLTHTQLSYQHQDSMGSMMHKNECLLLLSNFAIAGEIENVKCECKISVRMRIRSRVRRNTYLECTATPGTRRWLSSSGMCSVELESGAETCALLLPQPVIPWSGHSRVESLVRSKGKGTRWKMLSNSFR